MEAWLDGRAGRPLRPALRKLLLEPAAPADVRALHARIDRLESENAELHVALAGGAASGHVLFLETPAGYQIVESAEPAPPVEQLLFVQGRTFSIERITRSPFPNDRRPCLVCAPVG